MAPRNSYLNLLTRVLTRELFIDDPQLKEIRETGKDWPQDAETMVGNVRLRNVWDMCYQAAVDGLRGDFMECGVWKGGCSIMMAAIAKEYDLPNRTVVADSFQGCPVPNPEKYPADKGDPHHTYKFLAVSQEEVISNFKRYGLWNPDKVVLFPGWFKDTLPGHHRDIAVLRLDCDMYESTWQCLEYMYPRLQHRGTVIVDDYGAVAGCRKAVEDYRAAKKITAPIQVIDWGGIYWRNM